MERNCDACGDPYEAKTKRSKFCSVNCRVAASRGTKAPAEVPAAPKPPASTKVADSLATELTKLGVLETYEGAVAVGIAKQLDSGVVVGAAFSSLSKELDRRVDALRMKAERPDDPARAVKDRLAEKRLRLA